MPIQPAKRLKEFLTDKKVNEAFEFVRYKRIMDGFHLELIQEDRYQDMINHIKLYFVPDEPMGKCVNLRWDDDMENMLLANLKHNLSIAIVSDDSGEIIAGQVVIVGSKYDRFDKTKYHYNVGIVYDVCTNYVDSLFNIYDRYAVEEIIHLWQLAVKTEHRQKGIGTELIKAVKEFVGHLHTCIGPIVLRVEGSSNYSQRIFEKLGFSALATVHYSDYKDGGKIPFANTGEHESVKLYAMVVQKTKIST